MVGLFAVAVATSKGNDAHDHTEKSITYKKSFRRSQLSTDPIERMNSPVAVVDIRLRRNRGAMTDESNGCIGDKDFESGVQK